MLKLIYSGCDNKVLFILREKVFLSSFKKHTRRCETTDGLSCEVTHQGKEQRAAHSWKLLERHYPCGGLCYTPVRAHSSGEGNRIESSITLTQQSAPEETRRVEERGRRLGREEQLRKRGFGLSNGGAVNKAKTAGWLLKMMKSFSPVVKWRLVEEC